MILRRTDPSVRTAGFPGSRTTLETGTTIVGASARAPRALVAPTDAAEGLVDAIGTESVPAAGSTRPPIATKVPKPVFTARLTVTRPSVGAGPPAARKTRSAGFASGSEGGVNA